MPLSPRDLGLIVPAAGLLGDFAERAVGLLPLLVLPLRFVAQARSTARKLFMFLISTIGVATRP